MLTNVLRKTFFAQDPPNMDSDEENLFGTPIEASPKVKFSLKYFWKRNFFAFTFFNLSFIFQLQDSAEKAKATTSKDKDKPDPQARRGMTFAPATVALSDTREELTKTRKVSIKCCITLQ